MILTNEHGAPEAFVRAIQNDPYTKDGADFSVTELIKPPQVRRLWNEHETEISVDVSDEMFKLLGKGVHNVLEHHGPDGSTTEQRFHADHNGVSVSGAVDLIEADGSITDYKVTSTFSVMRGLKVDWERQLNLYGWLLRQNGITATKLTIVALCRDWTKSKVGNKNYPSSMVVVMAVPLWREGRQDDYLDQRIRAHTQEATLPCTVEERWARGAYQVNGKGRPRSFDTMGEATTFINMQKSGNFKIVPGNAKYVRCEGWCEVSPWCPQWNGGE